MNPVDQVRVRVTVTVQRNFRTARRSYLVERMIAQHTPVDDPRTILREEVVRLYDAARKDTA